ncbi:antiviral reverse transcriptase Drt3a [Massilia luteola]|uniref:antiviral reverse transcriptase Drt3a n=1 Tax=Massilia luteola TaxID=3081751 RepID=UPI002ACBDA62|nr:antiviral reverse transcriptase Drt3a [Massilia sp. Gc5]
MYDQSIHSKSLYKALRRSDFHQVFDLRDDACRAAILDRAVAVGEKGGWDIPPLKISKLKGKNIYSFPEFHDELLIRKINNNIRHFRKIKNPARTSIVTNLSRIAAEAVSYRIYRLDVKSFFESFSISHVLKNVDDIHILSLATKRVLRDLFKHFSASGGTGIPRGLAISSTLSELMMAEFDTNIKHMDNVFFYARYVDDIVIVTSAVECQSSFTKLISSLLPDGLKLSRKKQEIITVPKATKASTFKFSVEFLGYKFDVQDPGAVNTCRQVNLGISDGKLKKIKTRLVLAIKDYCKTKNMADLISRVQFLCGNLALADRDRGRQRLAGIFFNYHLIQPSSPSCGLSELDRFLHYAITSGRGPIFQAFKLNSTPAERKRLASFSFSKGFHGKVFMHYTGAKLKNIQECWKYA